MVSRNKSGWSISSSQEWTSAVAPELVSDVRLVGTAKDQPAGRTMASARGHWYWEEITRIWNHTATIPISTTWSSGQPDTLVKTPSPPRLPGFARRSE